MALAKYHHIRYLFFLGSNKVGRLESKEYILYQLNHSPTLGDLRRFDSDGGNLKERREIIMIIEITAVVAILTFLMGQVYDRFQKRVTLINIYSLTKEQILTTSQTRTIILQISLIYIPVVTFIFYKVVLATNSKDSSYPIVWTLIAIAAWIFTIYYQSQKSVKQDNSQVFDRDFLLVRIKGQDFYVIYETDDNRYVCVRNFKDIENKNYIFIPFSDLNKYKLGHGKIPNSSTSVDTNKKKSKRFRLKIAKKFVGVLKLNDEETRLLSDSLLKKTRVN